MLDPTFIQQLTHIALAHRLHLLLKAATRGRIINGQADLLARLSTEQRVIVILLTNLHTVNRLNHAAFADLRVCLRQRTFRQNLLNLQPLTRVSVIEEST